MAFCKDCGTQDNFFRISNNGLCKECEEKFLADIREETCYKEMEESATFVAREPLLLKDYNNESLGIRGDSLIITSNKKKLIIPISNIQSFEVEAGNNSLGEITIITTDSSATIMFDIGELPFARNIQDFIIHYEKVPEVTSVSVADEIRKYKELLDIGAITQEEFDAKKKYWLNL